MPWRIAPLVVIFCIVVAPRISVASAQSSGQDPSQAAPHRPVQVTCPWLTNGSAARALGADVAMTAAVSSPDEGSCRFTRRDEPMHSLEIIVGKNGIPACPSGSLSLTGIGNRAARCRMPAPHGDPEQMLSGRVRDLDFALILRGQKPPAKASDAWDDALEQLGEQVAGNLF